MSEKWDEAEWQRQVRAFKMKRLREGRNPLLDLMKARKSKPNPNVFPILPGMIVRTQPLTAKPPRTRKVRKQPPAPPKQLLPAPLPKNSAGFGKSWIGGDLYIASEDHVIPKAALDSMRRRGR